MNSHFNNVQTSVNNQNISTKSNNYNNNNNNSKATKEPAVPISTISNGRVTRTQKNIVNSAASSLPQLSLTKQHAVNNHSNTLPVKVTKKSSKRVRLRRQPPSLGKFLFLINFKIVAIFYLYGINFKKVGISIFSTTESWESSANG